MKINVFNTDTLKAILCFRKCLSIHINHISRKYSFSPSLNINGHGGTFELQFDSMWNLGNAISIPILKFFFFFMLPISGLNLVDLVCFFCEIK